MILEIANLEITPGEEAAFEAAVAQALPHFQAAKGFIDLKLRRSIEEPSLYHLFVQWQKLEDHTEGFRNSQGFQEWRQLAAPHFASPPSVSHNQLVELGD